MEKVRVCVCMILPQIVLEICCFRLVMYDTTCHERASHRCITRQSKAIELLLYRVHQDHFLAVHVFCLVSLGLFVPRGCLAMATILHSSVTNKFISVWLYVAERCSTSGPSVPNMPMNCYVAPCRNETIRRKQIASSKKK